MRARIVLVPSLLIGAALAMGLGSGSGEPQYTSDFGLECSNSFVPNGSNDFLSLQPGTMLRFEGEADGELVELQVTVLNETLPVPFEANGRQMMARTRVIEERQWVNGELTEISLNYMARCPRSGNIFLFGEDTEIFDGDEAVSDAGSWLAGEGDARPGLLMPSFFLAGSRYYQAIAPGVSMDRSEHVEMGLEIETPAGVFKDCVLVVETTPLEPDEESFKIYAPGIGLIVDDGLELIEYEP
jgi:hypothetical protein